MSSIRKPKRIRFFGSDGLVYPFLVKGGEDLRNDERVQQLFMLMNGVVSAPSAAAAALSFSATTDAFADHAATSAGVDTTLRACTYAVIPMSTQTGLLQWVANTVPLHSLISAEMAKDVRFCEENPKAAADVIQSKVFYPDRFDTRKLKVQDLQLKFLGGGHAADNYHKMFQHVDAAAVRDHLYVVM